MKKAAVASVAALGFFGGAGLVNAPMAGADEFPVIHQEATVDPNQIVGDTGLFPNGIIRVCITIGAASPDPNCIHI